VVVLVARKNVEDGAPDELFLLLSIDTQPTSYVDRLFVAVRTRLVKERTATA
jgi:hypothetical protein